MTEEGHKYYVDPGGTSQWEKPPGNEEPAVKKPSVRRKSLVRRTMSGLAHFSGKVKDHFRKIRKNHSEAISEDVVGLHLHHVELMSLICLFIMLWISMFFSVAECSQFSWVCLMLGGILISLNCAFILYCTHRVWIAFVAKNQEHIQIIKSKLGSRLKKIRQNKASRSDFDTMVVNPMTTKGGVENQSGDDNAATTIEMGETHFGKRDD